MLVLINWLPAVIFFCVYTLLCGLGSLLLLNHIEPFYSATQQFTGVTLPSLTSDEYSVFLYILIVGPICLCIGYKVGLLLVRQKKIGVFFNTDISLSWTMANIIYYCLLLLALRSLYYGNAVANLSSWNNYSDWVYARYSMFASLSFFEFVNIYNLLPTAAAVILLVKTSSRLTYFMRWLPMLITIAVDILLYQKKPIILTLTTCLGVLWISNFFYSSKKKFIAQTIILPIVTFIVVIVGYFITVLVPYLSSAYGLFHDVSRHYTTTLNDTKKNIIPSQGYNLLPAEKINSNEENVKVLAEVSLNKIVSTQPEIVLNEPKKEVTTQTIQKNLTSLEYAGLTLIMRTPVPVLFYPVVFPKQHPFYSFDFGQDILRIGTMPDDNRVIWEVMYPKIDGGAMAAPMNFIFYSQGGLIIALSSMAFVGAILALFWQFILQSQGAINFRSILSILLLECCIHLSIDSLRNTLVVSYGYIWPILFVIFIYFTTWLFSSFNKREKRQIHNAPLETRPKKLVI